MTRPHSGKTRQTGYSSSSDIIATPDIGDSRAGGKTEDGGGGPPRVGPLGRSQADLFRLARAAAAAQPVSLKRNRTHTHTNTHTHTLRTEPEELNSKLLTSSTIRINQCLLSHDFFFSNRTERSNGHASSS